MPNLSQYVSMPSWYYLNTYTEFNLYLQSLPEFKWYYSNYVKYNHYIFCKLQKLSEMVAWTIINPKISQSDKIDLAFLFDDILLEANELKNN